MRPPSASTPCRPGAPEAHGQLMYVLTCADGTLYTGYTVDLARRFGQHQRGVASKYTRSRLPVRLAGYWAFADRTSAMRAEHAFKQLSRREKLAQLEQPSAIQSFEGSKKLP